MDTTYSADDKVLVYTSAQLAVAAENRVTSGLSTDGSPRVATVLRELASEPGTYEIAYDDDGSGEFVTDVARFRPLMSS